MTDPNTHTPHTELPWTRHDIDPTCIIGGGRLVADVYGDGADEEDANTAFIVRAVNSHYGLLEALRRIADDDPSEPDFDGYEPRRVALAAIARAENA